MTCYEFVSLIISGLCSLATVAAVIVALYLAKNANTVKVKASVSKYVEVGGKRSFLIVNINNKSIHKIRVKGISLAIGKSKSKLTHFITKIFTSTFENHVYIEPKDSVDIQGNWSDFEQVYINLKNHKCPEILKEGLQKNMLFIVVYSSAFDKPLHVPFNDYLIESVNLIKIHD